MIVNIVPFLIKNKTFSDERGSFDKIFQSDDCIFEVKQINISKTSKLGAVRGIHGSKLGAEEKIVTCVSGVILDVCIDLRTESTSFGAVYSTRLSGPSKSYYIPKGFGHGFQCLTDDCIIHYCHNVEYDPYDQLNISPLSVGIKDIWELEISEISVRDTQAITIEDYHKTKTSC
jgi:dTDP-4-dehydrorhamnose 3,5-epimerase|tara:strand:+ start:1808 stop:2329 length:522 start_codon:yes stop_codon:yes gene_type:complete